MWRSGWEKKVERRLAARRRHERQQAGKFTRIRKTPDWQRPYPPLRWDQEGHKRALWGEVIENTAGAVWSSLWRRGS